MTMMTVVAPSKLRLWRTVGQAYAVWARNFRDLIRTVWPWMLLTAPVLALFSWWEEPHLMETMRATRAGRPFADPAPVLSQVWYIGRQLIPLPAVASTAVAWHRLLLRDEHPGPGIYLRLDSIVAGYAILAFWIGVIILAPGYVSRIFQIVTGTSATMGDVFFCIFPGAAIIGGISLWLLLPHGRATGTLALIVMSLLWIPVGMISVGMLSLAYRHFFERSA